MTFNDLNEFDNEHIKGFISGIDCFRKILRVDKLSFFPKVRKKKFYE